MRALTTERIRAVYSLRNFNTTIINVRVCVSVLVSMSIQAAERSTYSFDDGKELLSNGVYAIPCTAVVRYGQ